MRQEELVLEQSVVQLSEKSQQWLEDYDKLLSKKKFSVDEELMQHLRLELSILCGMHTVMVWRRSRTAKSLTKCYQTSR
jgi:hypothetical protein